MDQELLHLLALFLTTAVCVYGTIIIWKRENAEVRGYIASVILVAMGIVAILFYLEIVRIHRTSSSSIRAVDPLCFRDFILIDTDPDHKMGYPSSNSTLVDERCWAMRKVWQMMYPKKLKLA